jgi:hypothetical protein
MNHAVESPTPPPLPVAEREMTFAERTVAAAGAAVMSAVVVNPLDVAKVCTVVGGEYVRTYVWRFSFSAYLYRRRGCKRKLLE